MGYYTQFSLTTSEDLPEDADDWFDNLSDYEGLLSSMLSGQSDTIKWYSWEEDMTKLSDRFPHILFTLDGNGEESGDIWRAYFKNGKSQIVRAIISFDDFDENKLE